MVLSFLLYLNVDARERIDNGQTHGLPALGGSGINRELRCPVK